MLIENKLNGKSFDIVEDNISKLKELFPEIVSGDNEVDVEALVDIFNNNGDEIVDDSEEYYKFTWWGKKEAKKEAKNTTTKTLRPVKKDSKNWDSTQNIYIEGDNLYALKILLGSYRNKIKMMYIDPPYNTGKDFVYKDNRTETTQEHLENTGQLSEEGHLYENPKTDGKYHSNWLNMMYPRLYLARKLLTDDGVIFISIDDYEVENLKKICNEIFGEENFLANLIWNKQHSQQQGIFKRYHEYILVYGKNYSNIGNIQCKEGIIDAGALKKISTKNPASEFTFPKGVRFDAPDGTVLKGTFGDSEKVTVVDGEMISKDGKLLNEVTLSAGWTQKNQMTEYFYGKGDVYDTKGQKVIEFYFNSAGKLKCLKEKSAITPSSLLQKYGMVSEQTKQLSSLLGGNYFDNPKPVKMIKEFESWFLKNGDIVMDFFSGSATTAQSLFELNSERDEDNQFILVQLPEETDEKSEAYKAGYENICEIGKERIRRAGDKIVEESGKNDLDIGFKVFRIDESNFIPWNPNLTADNVEQAILSTGNNLVDGRSELDLVYEILLKELNMDLNCPIDETNVNGRKVYIIDNGYALICLENNLDVSIADDLLKLKDYLMVEYCEVILKDEALDDNTSINVYESLKSKGVKFKTI